MSYKKLTSGFTLLELLISLFILAIISTIITSGLNLALKTQLAVAKKYKSLSEIQLALTIMESDFQQIIDRPIRSENGVEYPSIILVGNRLEFTRSGYINPFSMNKRSNLQRISYQISGTTLIRSTWNILDRTRASISSNQAILSQVEDFNIHMISPHNKMLSSEKTKYPIANKGIRIEMNIKGLGYVNRVFALGSNTFETSYTENT